MHKIHASVGNIGRCGFSMHLNLGVLGVVLSNNEKVVYSILTEK